MRDRMSTVAQYLDNRQKMGSMNDSVIICDAFTPKLKELNKRKNAKKREVKCRRRINDLTEKLSNVQIRPPLRTVYESPLDHRVHNTCNADPSLVINLAAKRFRNDRGGDVPPAKKQKTDKINETIVIVSDDDEPRPSMPSRARDIVLVDLDKTVSETMPKKSPKKKGKRRRSLRIHEQMMSKNGTNSKADKEDEEISVIWDSTSVRTNERINEGVNGLKSPKGLFFFDTAGDKSNYQKEWLEPIKMTPPKSPPCQSPTAVRKKKGKGKKKLQGKLREIIVDGCNVAIGYSHSKVFTKMGLKLVYDYFRGRGHSVKIFLPQHERKRGREYLESWYRRGDVIFTPSRQIGGKNIVSYDDRFIVDYATKCNGIIVTSDQYRDLWDEKPEWRETIEKRLLVPTFVGDYVMFPEDPLGRKGPKLDEFLRH